MQNHEAMKSALCWSGIRSVILPVFLTLSAFAGETSVAPDGHILKRALRLDQSGENLLKAGCLERLAERLCAGRWLHLSAITEPMPGPSEGFLRPSS